VHKPIEPRKKTSHIESSTKMGCNGSKNTDIDQSKQRVKQPNQPVTSTPVKPIDSSTLSTPVSTGKK
jgi:hypothetical protein